ncbi:hypothetical protein KIW84_014042 [Lathyrus oleraceus]|uniref:VWFA domain-containing protein n=1 Tax=Pisum sativum TaxID=3888 RepID=A0A9D5BLQ9_PEA|nr:hypothetical protein KIW84_014042 [Pisum sativum]
MEERAVGIMQATPVTTREKELHLQAWFWIAPNCLPNTCNQLLSDSNKDCRSSAKFCWNASSSIITNNAISERNICGKSTEDTDAVRATEIKTCPEVSSVPRSNTCANFTVLVHLKATAAAAASTRRQNLSRNQTQTSQTLRAPVDLVTVLDISGSMAGTKLALLKRAMGFVIQNLGTNDRLSVIVFSSTARRLFPLCKMTDSGRQQALQAVNSLVANGGTNIAGGMRKGAKIMEDRKEKNPVANIILLSDGQDNYTVGSSGNDQPQPNYHLLLPISISGRDNSGFQIPVHAFGFGADHDASSMHSISEISGGTFTFTVTETVNQSCDQNRNCF